MSNLRPAYEAVQELAGHRGLLMVIIAFLLRVA